MSMHDMSASRLPPFAPNEFVCRWLYHGKFSPPEDECHRARYDLDTASLVRHEHLQGYMLLIGSQLEVVLIHCGSRNIAEKKNIPHLPSKTFMASIGTTQEPEADPCAFSKLTGLTGRSGAQTTTDTVTCPQMKTQPHRWNAVTTPTACRKRLRMWRMVMAERGSPPADAPQKPTQRDWNLSRVCRLLSGGRVLRLHLDFPA
jgi:hypothetical protein